MAKPNPNQRRQRERKPNLKANAAYENAHLVAQDLVQRIGELLFELPAPDNDEHPIDWTHVGDLNEINRQLSETIAFMSGTNK